MEIFENYAAKDSLEINSEIEALLENERDIPVTGHCLGDC